MIFVIGSGPTGVSAALSLVENGADVTMLDIGQEIESEGKQCVTQLSRSEPSDWNPDTLKELRMKSRVHSGGMKDKLIFGSDYPYRGLERYQPIRMENAEMIQTMAKGGLATVWGGAVMPFEDIDLAKWPIQSIDLRIHYDRIMSLIKCTNPNPIPKSILNGQYSGINSFAMCNQMQSFYSDLKRNEAALERENIYFSPARLAVGFKSQADHQSCRYCGLCLYGCPYGLIYSSEKTLMELMKKKNFNYLKNILVEKLVETNGEIRIKAKNIIKSENCEFDGEKVFLAAGLVSSTRIMLKSLEAYNQPLKLRHSEQFSFPLLRYKGIEDVEAEKIHTLSQLFISVLDPLICSNTVHLQVYAYNDLYPEVLKKMIGPLMSVFKKPTNQLLSRLLVVKGYLHSDHSSHITAMLTKDGNRDSLVLEGTGNLKSKGMVRKVLKKMYKNRKQTGAFPVTFMNKLGLPGGGNHSGGSFPMRIKPKEFESDILGRPYGFKNVHMVDSSVFPSIPATTITLTAMANAHRIATKSRGVVS